ncbi:MAG: WXG100 family type VII secretion target [Oscillospiraceae bacterium]|nr:WXG100 family type VII secretion target [Oscillospiraceae bacterium]
MAMIPNFLILPTFLSDYFMGSMTVRVTYEELDAAAAELERQIGVADQQCADIRQEIQRLQNIWQGEASEKECKQLNERLEVVTTTLNRFRVHAEHLRMICANYVKASAQAAGQIDTLSSDVIV